MSLLVADHLGKGMRQHRKRYVAVPGPVLAHLVLVETEAALRLGKAILDSPARTGHLHHLLKRGALLWGEDDIEGEILGVFDAASDQQPVSEATLFLGKLQPVEWDQSPVE